MTECAVTGKSRGGVLQPDIKKKKKTVTLTTLIIFH